MPSLWLIRLLPLLLVAGMASALPGSGVVAPPALTAAAVGSQTAAVVPGFGPPGTTVWATGRGWPAGDRIAIDACAGSTGADCGIFSGLGATALAGPDGGFAGVPLEVPAVSRSSFLLFHFQDTAPGRAALSYDVPFTVTGAAPVPTPLPAPSPLAQPAPGADPWSWCSITHGPCCTEVDDLGCLSWWCPAGGHWAGGHWRGRPPGGRWPGVEARQALSGEPPAPSALGEGGTDTARPSDPDTWRARSTPTPSPSSTPYADRSTGEPPPEGNRPPPAQPTPEPYQPPPTNPPSQGYHPPPTNPPSGYHPPPTNPPSEYHPPPPQNGGGYQQPPPRQRGGYQPPPPPPHQGAGYQPPPPQGGGYHPPPPQGGGYQPPPRSGGGYQPPPRTR